MRINATYVRGDLLPAHLQQEVLAKYVHRLTVENVAKFPQVMRTRAVPPTMTDAEWLVLYGFAVTQKGQLDKRQRFAESAYVLGLVPARAIAVATP